MWGAPKIGLPTAWETTTGSRNVVVAVVDTGVELSHPDLQGSLVAGWDFVNNDADPQDDQGHGTAVAGIIAARANNGIGIAGYCPNCSIMPVKAIGADGSGTAAHMAAGIIWAADHGARVINMSFALTNAIPEVQRAVEYAHARGVVLVGGTGNSGTAEPTYPAAYPNVIAAAGSDERDVLYPWANFGASVDVAAPGCAVTTMRGGSYGGGFCGGSAVAPVVSALAGLALSYNPTLGNAQVEQAITSTAVPIANVTAGRVDAARLLSSLKR